MSADSRRRHILRAPAVRALAIQLICLPFTYSMLWLLLRARLPLGEAGLPLAAAILQGTLAAACSAWRRLAPWWLAIQLLFPLALLGGLGLRLPPWLFLAVFVLMVLVYWSTFRTQVPYYPSGKRAWDEVAALLPADARAMIDIGSGLGGLVLDLAARRPDVRCDGIELAPLPWLASRLRALGRRNVRFLLGDYESLDFAQYELVFAYLSPAAMPALYRKAAAEMRAGTLLLSYEFLITTRSPDLTIRPRGEGPLLYGWHF